MTSCVNSIRLLAVTVIILLINSLSGGDVPQNWRSLKITEEQGLLLERQKVWRDGRLWHMLDAEDGYLLSGFEKRPGKHPWQGEHVGKWLHAAVLAQLQTGDARLMEAITETVRRLVATQQPDGYMGTYGPDYTFMAMPENKSLKDVADDVVDETLKKTRPPGGWDTWTLRYNIYGLLTYDAWHPDESVVDACRKMADLLIEYYGPGKYDLTKYGTRQGISATTLLESIVMLYERTRDPRYLAFAEHIVEMSEKNPRLSLMGTMLDGGSVVQPGDGKAYQLMANLLGYLRLYRATGNKSYMETVLRGWEKIRMYHTFVSGGPWSMKKDYNGNSECFAHPEDFDPSLAHVETCSTTTWIQLNLHLQELTGEARYAAEAERALFNALFAAQYHQGLDWCYFTRCNCDNQPFEEKITCCASSGPRALEMISQYVVGESDGGISLASLVPCSFVLPEAYGGATVWVSGGYPLHPGARISFVSDTGMDFPLRFRLPVNAELESLRINGKSVNPQKDSTGFLSVRRKWKKGDALDIAFTYKVASETVAVSDGKKYAAFSYGPWALSRVMAKGDALMEPFLGKGMTESQLVSMIEVAPVKDHFPIVRIRDTGMVMVPYYTTADRSSGSQTYFQY